MQLNPIAAHMTYVEKYRPPTLDECILPKALKAKLKEYARTGSFPNLIFVGGPGTGKTTAAKALAHELGADYLFINASMASMDDLRTTIQQFAGTISLTSNGRKIVQLDEADSLNHHVQGALRAFMEAYSANCGFILTCNYPYKLIEPLRSSRVAQLEFKVPPSEKAELCAQAFKRMCAILDAENVSYDKQVVAAMIKRYFPDLRKVLNELQAATTGGNIDTGALAVDEEWSDLYKMLRDKRFKDMRTWVASHSDVDSAMFFRKLYTDLNSKLVEDTVPQLVLTIAEYQFKAAFVADQEINMVACLTEIMAGVAWK